MTFSIMAFSIIALRKTIFHIMAVSITTVSIMTLSIMTFSIITLRITILHIMALGILTVSIMPLSIMKFSKSTLSTMALSIKTCSKKEKTSIILAQSLYYQ